MASASLGTAARPTARSVLLVALVGVALLAVLINQIVQALDLIDAEGIFTAAGARGAVEVNLIACVVIVAAAIALPARWRWAATAAPVLGALAIIGASATLGGEFLGITFAVLVTATSWEVGERLLRHLGLVALAERAVVAWVAGIGPVCLVTLLLGRVEGIRWWTLGLLVIVLGTSGVVRVGRLVVGRRTAILAALRDPATSAAFGVLALMAGWAAIYTAAPETQFDALAGKEYLPSLWAATHEIAPLREHPQMNVAGWFQVLAVSGHLFDGDSIGRYMQLSAFVLVPLAVFSWARPHVGVGAIAAVAVGLIPHAFWQASTAYDDLLLAFAALAVAVSVAEALRAGARLPVRETSIVIGLLAGTLVSMKLHLSSLALVLLVGWVLAGRSSGTLLKRGVWGAVGSAITAGPPLLLRFIDTGNPVFPAYNNIFRSEYYRPVNETYDFPYGPEPEGLLWYIGKSFSEPSLYTQTVPPAGFGITVVVVLFALIAAPLLRRRHPGTLLLWSGLGLSVLFWWLNLRYLRYLLPLSFVAVILVTMNARGLPWGPWRSRAAAVGLGVFAISAMPVAVAHMWNAPNKKMPFGTAFGTWDELEYENTAMFDRPVLTKFDEVSPPGAVVITTLAGRSLVSTSRDFYSPGELYLAYELDHGRQPSTGEEAFSWAQERGIEWVILGGEDRYLLGEGPLDLLLRDHGEPVYSWRNYALWKLVDEPRPATSRPCDDRLAGAVPCWEGTLDDDPGFDAAESAAIFRTIPVCEGQTVVVDARQSRGTVPSQVVIQFTSPRPTDATTGVIATGRPSQTFASAPPAATSATVSITPSPDGRVSEARVGTIGATCG